MSSYPNSNAGQVIYANSVPNLSLNGALANTQISIFDVMSPGYHPQVKKYEVFESPEDPLALSVAWKKLRDDGKSPTGKLLDSILFKYLTNEDRQQAEVIRDYYSKKLMVSVLRDDRTLTNFRKDLSEYLNSSKYRIQENQMGMVYYLPTLYEYDLNLDKLKDQVNLNTDWNRQQLRHYDCKKQLTPVTKFLKERKNIEVLQYWFRDEENNAVQISINPENPLLHIFDYMFENVDKIEISGNYYNSKIDNLNYYKIDKWKLVQS